MAMNFGTKLTKNRPQDNWALFAPTPLYAAAKLYNVAMGQIHRSTERISSFLL